VTQVTSRVDGPAAAAYESRGHDDGAAGEREGVAVGIGEAGVARATLPRWLLDSMESPLAVESLVEHPIDDALVAQQPPHGEHENADRREWPRSPDRPRSTSLRTTRTRLAAVGRRRHSNAASDCNRQIVVVATYTAAGVRRRMATAAGTHHWRQRWEDRGAPDARRRESEQRVGAVRVDDIERAGGAAQVIGRPGRDRKRGLWRDTANRRSTILLGDIRPRGWWPCVTILTDAPRRRAAHELADVTLERARYDVDGWAISATVTGWAGHSNARSPEPAGGGGHALGRDGAALGEARCCEVGAVAQRGHDAGISAASVEPSASSVTTISTVNAAKPAATALPLPRPVCMTMRTSGRSRSSANVATARPVR
jgi:hypothetical protein